MHTTQYDNVTFIHDGDFRGDVLIRIAHEGQPTHEIVVKSMALVTFVGELVRQKKIRELEQMPASQLLELRP